MLDQTSTCHRILSCYDNQPIFERLEVSDVHILFSTWAKTRLKDWQQAIVDPASPLKAE